MRPPDDPEQSFADLNDPAHAAAGSGPGFKPNAEPLVWVRTGKGKNRWTYVPEGDKNFGKGKGVALPKSEADARNFAPAGQTSQPVPITQRTGANGRPVSPRAPAARKVRRLPAQPPKIHRRSRKPASARTSTRTRPTTSTSIRASSELLRRARLERAGRRLDHRTHRVRCQGTPDPRQDFPRRCDNPRCREGGEAFARQLAAGACKGARSERAAGAAARLRRSGNRCGHSEGGGQWRRAYPSGSHRTVGQRQAFNHDQSSRDVARRSGVSAALAERRGRARRKARAGRRMIDHLDLLLFRLFRWRIDVAVGRHAGALSAARRGLAQAWCRRSPTSPAIPANSLNVYLADLRENRKLRSNERERTTVGQDVFETPPARRVDCHYLISAWSPVAVSTAIDPTLDEHALLAEAARVLGAHDELDPVAIYAATRTRLRRFRCRRRSPTSASRSRCCRSKAFPKLARVLGNDGRERTLEAVRLRGDHGGAEGSAGARRPDGDDDDHAHAAARRARVDGDALSHRRHGARRAPTPTPVPLAWVELHDAADVLRHDHARRCARPLRVRRRARRRCHCVHAWRAAVTVFTAAPPQRRSNVAGACDRRAGADRQLRHASSETKEIAMAVQVSYPGVYIEEFAPGAPIQGVGTEHRGVHRRRRRRRR